MSVRSYASRAGDRYSAALNTIASLTDPVVLAMLRATAALIVRSDSQGYLRYDAPDSLAEWFSRTREDTVVVCPADDDTIDETYRGVGMFEVLVPMVVVVLLATMLFSVGDVAGWAFGAFAHVVWIIAVACAMLRVLENADAISVEVEHG